MKSVPAMFVVAIVGVVLAMIFLPWWGSVLLILGLAVVGKFALGRLLKDLFLNPFRMKGAVLHGATAQIHSIEVVTPPTSVALTWREVGDATQNGSESGQVEGRGAQHYFQLDVTITPQPVEGQLTHWEPGQLQLVQRGSHPVGLGADTDDDACSVLSLEVEQEGLGESDAGWKFSGPQRLHLLVRVSETVRELEFRYYGETFGEVSLPLLPAKAA
jgi:hypothetical protein